MATTRPSALVTTSPLEQLRPGLPPTLIQHGDADATTPIAGIHAFVERALANGDRCELAVYPGEKHGFFNWKGPPEPPPMFLATRDRLDRFLTDLGY
jgi:dipeptidyl aminopeptidase/acylaminoacyl peptidase